MHINKNLVVFILFLRKAIFLRLSMFVIIPKCEFRKWYVLGFFYRLNKISIKSDFEVVIN